MDDNDIDWNHTHTSHTRRSKIYDYTNAMLNIGKEVTKPKDNYQPIKTIYWSLLDTDLSFSTIDEVLKYNDKLQESIIENK